MKNNPEFKIQNQKSMWLAIFACVALIWLIAARVAGPTDLGDYTQFKTVGYTTDIVVNGGERWLLPRERGEFPATKPPLYNWFAAPFVKLLGFNSELAHKFPSLVALCVCWLVVIRNGRRVNEGADDAPGAIGWLAGLILAANYAMFKLGYVARPDMMVTMWLTLAWAAATQVLIERAKPASGGGWLVMGFWVSIALAAMTKGPAAIVGIAYAILAARMIGGSWRAISALRPIIGLSAMVIVAGAWLYAVWRIDPHHLTETLWRSEFWGRITGTGPQGLRDAPGLVGWLKTLAHHPLYFLGRFAPWSIFAIAAIFAIGRSEDRLRSSSLGATSRADRPDSCGERQTHGSVAARPTRATRSALWLRGATLQVLLVIGIFSLSAGKRADYIAAAFPPGALLAAWWLLHSRIPWWVSPAAAVVILAILTERNFSGRNTDLPGYAPAIGRFIDEATVQIASNPLPVICCDLGDSHVPALLGSTRPTRLETALQFAAQGDPYWLITTQNETGGNCTEALARKSPRELTIESILRSEMPDSIRQVRLYRVTPAPARPPDSSR